MSEAVAATPDPALTPKGGEEPTLTGARGPEVHFLFEQRKGRMQNAVGRSFAAHLAAFVALIVIARMVPEATTAIVERDLKNYNIVWLPAPGPGGGGGGGGNRSLAPPRQAELPGKDRITVPVTK